MSKAKKREYIMLIEFSFLMLFICLSKCITCPQYSLKPYKDFTEGRWSFIIPDNNQVNASFSITRDTDYYCFNLVNVRFRTRRRLQFNVNKRHDYYEVFGSSLGTCGQQCNSKNVSIKLSYRNRDWSTWFGWSESKRLGEFVYLIKNCDKLYWTAWTEMSNCSTLHRSIYTRQCVDCDGEAVNATYCDGDESKYIECHHFWSEWAVMGQCNVIGCNSTGNRIRKRQCLYGEGIEATNVQLCSTYLNESSVLIEQCDNTNLALNCTQSTSNTSNFNGFYVGIGVVATLIFALFISLAVLNYFRHKNDKSISNDVTNQTNQNFSLYEMAIESPSTRQGIQTAELNVYFQIEETLQNAYKGMQPIDPELYQQVMTNGVKTVISTEYENQQTTENNTPLYSTVQNPVVKKEHAEVYSTLDKPNKLQDSDYSSLGPR